MVLFTATCIGLLAVPAAAQMSNGSMSGAVIDPQGAVVVDADVTATNKATNKVFNTVSGKDGLFNLNLLPNGTYRVEISKTGFRKLVLDNVPVNIATDQGLGQLILEIGEVTATVEVISTPPALESTQSQISTAITSTTIQNFPGVLENQGLDNMVLSVPGVVNGRDVAFSNTNGPQFAVNGLRGRSTDQQIDGQNNNDNSVTGPALAVTDSEWVAEYQATTSNFGAEYGRNSGAVINVVTKSGSNSYHGSLYATDQNQRWNTLTSNQKAFEGLTSVPILNDVFAGGTAGGRIIKDKLFFFGGFNTEIVNAGSVFGTGNLTPTPAGVAAMAQCLPNSTSVQALQTYGPYAIKGGNPTPQGTVKSVSLPCADGSTALIDQAGVQRVLNGDSRTYNYVVRIDYQTKKDQLYGRYAYSKSTFYNLDPGSSLAAAGYPFNEPSLTRALGVSWTRAISTQMANEFRFAWGKEEVTFGSNSLGNTIPPTGDVGNALSNILFNSTSLLQFGPPTNFPQGRTVKTWQLQDNWTYAKGRHSLKAGVNWTYQISPNTFLPNYNGQDRFSSWATYAENTPNRIRIASGTPLLNFNEKDTFLYFQDDFKVTRNLTLNLGLTWSYFGQPANLFHNSTVKSQTGSDPLWNPALPLSVTTFPSIPAPWNSFGPNFGFAWSPGSNWLTGANGKTVIRGGYRMAYDPPFYNIYLNISSASPQVLLNTLTGTVAGGLPLLAQPTGVNVRQQLAPFLQTGIFDPRNFNETSITPKFSPDRAQQWSLGVQREVTKAGAIEVRYVGNVGQNLFQSIDGNPYIAGLANLYPNLVPAGMTPCPAASAAVPLAVGRANCDLGIVRERTNTGYSSYNGLQFEARFTNLWNQLTLKSAYTFSKTLDNTTEIFATSAGGNTNAFAQSQVNYKGAEYGISGLNFPNNWYLTVIEQLPFHRSQQGFVGRVLGGWSVSAVYQLSSGQPYTPSQAGLNCGSGGGACAGASSQNPFDPAFNGAFVGADGALRPFWGTPTAPAQQVGMFAGDACNYFAITGTEPICQMSPTALVSLNGLNATTLPIGSYNPAVISKQSVRFIANTPIAEQTFGTPFGNVARNVLSDYHTNIVNMAFFKTTNITEKVKLQFHADFLNALNHPNYGSIDAFIDDAGFYSEFTGFANPYVQNGGSITSPTYGRSIRFGIKLFF
jgi:Carboxypeptidase regulatory-like domain